MFEADVCAGETVSFSFVNAAGGGLLTTSLARARACQAWIAKANNSEPPMAGAVVGLFSNRSREA